jgi:hypothetical protein
VIILLPDIAGHGNAEAAAYYGSEAGASLSSFPALDFMAQVLSRPGTMKLWTRLLVTYSGMMLRLAATHTKTDVITTPGFAVYEPGEVIIAQGERAQYVFNLTAGLADVLVDGVPVGIISPGEIFGAMAALTHADRSATVRARSRCSVVKVPNSQFTDLIKTNPATIHALPGRGRQGVPGLLHVRHPRPGAAPCRRRAEAGAAAHPLRDERARPVGDGQVQEVRAHRRRRARQVPPARRQRLL